MFGTAATAATASADDDDDDVIIILPSQTTLILWLSLSTFGKTATTRMGANLYI